MLQFIGVQRGLHLRTLSVNQDRGRRRQTLQSDISGGGGPSIDSQQQFVRAESFSFHVQNIISRRQVVDHIRAGWAGNGMKHFTGEFLGESNGGAIDGRSLRADDCAAYIASRRSLTDQPCGTEDDHGDRSGEQTQGFAGRASRTRVGQHRLLCTYLECENRDFPPAGVARNCPTDCCLLENEAEDGNLEDRPEKHAGHAEGAPRRRPIREGHSLPWQKKVCKQRNHKPCIS